MLLNSGSMAKFETFNITGRPARQAINDLDIDDAVRKDMFKYWLHLPDTFDPRLEIVDRLVEQGDEQIFDEITFDEPVAYESLTTPGLETIFPVITQRIRVEVNRNNPMFQSFVRKGDPAQFDPVKWEEFFDGYKRDSPRAALHVDFFDNVFELQTPYDLSGFGSGQNVPGGLWANVESSYNFFDRVYESALAAGVPEELIPNLYYFRNESISDAIVKILSQNLSLPLNIIPRRLGVPQKDRTVVQKNNGITKFLRKYAQRFQSTTESDESKKQATNIVILPDFDLSELNETKFNFPMHAEIEWKTNGGGDLLDFIVDRGLEQELFFSLFSGEKQTGTFKQFDVNIYDNQLMEESTSTLPQFDMLEWTENFVNGDTYDESFVEENAIVLAERSELSTLQRSFLSAALFLKLRTYIAENLRTIEETFNGQKCSNETFFYQVSKHARLNDGSFAQTPTQSFFLFNTGEGDIHKMIDSQVKYEKNYLYKIAAHQLVVGSKYRYYNMALTDNDPTLGSAHFDVLIRPDIKIIATPFYQEEVFMLDTPPIFPDVTVSTFIDNKNKVLLRFQPNSGRLMLKPVILGNSIDEREKINAFAKSQKVNPRGPITFANDDAIAQYEIFRTRRRPIQINDFSGRLVKTLDVKTEGDAWVDRIFPNVKYYYTFRSKDNHGHVSNPTQVFEVEIVDDDGAVYPVINVIPLEQIEAKDATKQVQKYIRILPTLEQTILNRNASGLKQSNTAKGKRPILGVKGNSVFGKKIKVRLRSKQSGKMLDINLRFNLKHLGDET